MWMSQSCHTVSVIAAAMVVMIAGFSGAAGATTAQDQETFEVTLDADGDATVTITSTYDLTVDERRQAFRSLQNDQATRDQYAADWADQLGIVATNASEATGREMTIKQPSISASTTNGGDTGLVTLKVTWMNLAAVDGETLRVTEPFSSGFTPDRQFTVVTPEGYELTANQPAPETTEATSAAYPPGTNLSGFEVTAAPTADSTGDDSGGSIPGFGPVTAVIGVLLAVSLISRRR